MKKKVIYLIFCVIVIITNIWLSLLPEKAAWRRFVNELIIIIFTCGFWDTFKDLTKEK